MLVITGQFHGLEPLELLDVQGLAHSFLITVKTAGRVVHQEQKEPKNRYGRNK